MQARRTGAVIGAFPVERPRFSWTRIKGESNVQGGGENGSVEGRGTGRGIGATGVRADDAAAGAGSLAPGQRWSASRKRDVVLRRLRGESLEALSREVGVEIYRLEEWRERAMAGLELGLQDRHGEPVAEVLDAAKRHIGELSMEIELLRERARAAEQRLPLAMRRFAPISRGPRSTAKAIARSTHGFGSWMGSESPARGCCASCGRTDCSPRTAGVRAPRRLTTGGSSPRRPT